MDETLNNTMTEEGSAGRAGKASHLVQRNGRIGFQNKDSTEFSARTNFSVGVHGVVESGDKCLLGAVFKVERSDSLNESR